jgi:hypothetical protein
VYELVEYSGSDLEEEKGIHVVEIQIFACTGLVPSNEILIFYDTGRVYGRSAFLSYVEDRNHLLRGLMGDRDNVYFTGCRKTFDPIRNYYCQGVKCKKFFAAKN